MKYNFNFNEKNNNGTMHDLRQRLYVRLDKNILFKNSCYSYIETEIVSTLKKCFIFIIMFHLVIFFLDSLVVYLHLPSVCLFVPKYHFEKRLNLLAKRLDIL